jgi:hypothetical protein
VWWGRLGPPPTPPPPNPQSPIPNPHYFINIFQFLILQNLNYKNKMMLTIDESQEKYSSPSTESSRNSSPQIIIKPKISIKESINIDIILVESLLQFLFEKKNLQIILRK